MNLNSIKTTGMSTPIPINKLSHDTKAQLNQAKNSSNGTTLGSAESPIYSNLVIATLGKSDSKPVSGKTKPKVNNHKQLGHFTQE